MAPRYLFLELIQGACLFGTKWQKWWNYKNVSRIVKIVHSAPISSFVSLVKKVHKSTFWLKFCGWTLDKWHIGLGCNCAFWLLLFFYFLVYIVPTYIYLVKAILSGGGQHLSVSRFYLPKGNLLFTLNAITPFISYALCKNSCILWILKRVYRLLNKQPLPYTVLLGKIQKPAKGICLK